MEILIVRFVPRYPAKTGGTAYGKRSASTLQKLPEPNLELRVITLNISKGHNKELMEQCQTLREYAQYVEKVRNYTKDMNLDAAVERAVEEKKLRRAEFEAGVAEGEMKKAKGRNVGQSDSRNN